MIARGWPASCLDQRDGYDPAYHQVLAGLEAENWWFNARNDLIIMMMRRWFPSATKFLEIGCGTGFVLEAIASEFPDLAVYGSEMFLEGLEVARERVPRGEFFQMDARRIPFTAEFDVIGAFDVIEHIRADEGRVAPGGAPGPWGCGCRGRWLQWRA